jgi:arginase
MARSVRLIGAPTDYGANRRGVDMGPSAIRYAGLASAVERADATPIEEGDVGVVRAREGETEMDPGDDRAKHLAEIRECVTGLSDSVADACAAGALPVVLGGDHSVAIGSVTGASRDVATGLLWFDAHGDFNTPETTPSGNVHGMPLAALLGRGSFADEAWTTASGLQEENVVLVGLRSLDPPEREAIRESAVTAYTISDIDSRGIAPVVEEALDIATDGVDELHVSLDVDWLDPTEAPGVGTPVPGGVSYREAHTAMELVAERDEDSELLRSMDVVEVNPILDEHNRTAELACELVASLLGERIL